MFDNEYFDDRERKPKNYNAPYHSIQSLKTYEK